ncbi:hypothetical protein [Streptomyces sp. PR69]|nr:hypothetical protein [Streptomyces sp. PR69]
MTRRLLALAALGLLLGITAAHTTPTIDPTPATPPAVCEGAPAWP